MARGVDGRTVFQDDEDRRFFLRTLKQVSEESSACLLAYCLMSNHFHLAIRIESVPLSLIMQRVLTSHSLTFNQKYDRTGHLFQARYKAVLCADTAQFTALIRYIHMNPVRAGITTKPALWPWSSYTDYLRRGRDGMIDSELDLPDLDAPLPKDFNPWPISANDNPTTILREPHFPSVSVDEIAAGCLEGSGVSADCLRSKSRRRTVTRIKHSLIEHGLKNGHTLTRLAQWLGISLSSAQHYLKKKITITTVGLTP
ncbi:MAG: transposase [Elusimicrobia bacterium]|nr:transposase [Elusimicrobiota bacterium]